MKHYALTLQQPSSSIILKFDSIWIRLWDCWCVVLREIDFLLKFSDCIKLFTFVETNYSTWIQIYAGLNHRKKMKAETSRLIPRKLAANLELLILIIEIKHWWMSTCRIGENINLIIKHSLYQSRGLKTTVHRTVTRKSSLGGFYVCARGLHIENL